MKRNTSQEDSILEIKIFNSENFQDLCNHLADTDPDFKTILDTYGYPPMWTRENTFKSLVHIILEQQVSLASALAALNKLKKKTTKITPENILNLNDEEMRACYVSRQKSVYIRGLAQAITDKHLSLEELSAMTNDDARKNLVKLKGIGNWTVDVYLMFTLQRADIFPIGDLAAVNALKRLKQLPTSITKEEILEISEQWKPFRSVASIMLWHYYLSQPAKKNISF
ncbi:DNA-3-methyladenine glycosylase family protein [Elizabethkingia meningoseptica]|uniref:DNA-3-methyladenine glycosylase family protein n=1 Tax=Elizabethkingia meningoseptica TaxID=238 RepID=UPI0008420457|nr:DNA-3-methyladenine glycosylase [Elizabethkingia meningoseptica]ODM54171.1 3-methyladenine DNA glycosylase [Elizabethkingia meningoseptica]OHT29398.1 3-methyladenine DNA glycosylase [Elizabethkingia meningoseptica]OPC08555.1 3-methyladenine DNA glycosylase [Elizabethkingia meningoseptica]